MKRVFAATIFILAACSISVLAQSESREDLLKQIESKRAELSVLENRLLAPAAEDKTAFAEFLKQENTGLIRLLPREKYDETPDKMTLTVRGGGAFYSFARLTHAYGYGSDIMLEHGDLSEVWAGADYGMLTKLEGASLEDISIELPGVLFLAKYNAVASEPEARVEQRRFSTGTTIEGIPYSRRLPAQIGATYLLRSISYDRSDLLVAVKVVRQDTDGSLIIAWKLLKKFPKPALARN
jgi:hypothetical protein